MRICSPPDSPTRGRTSEFDELDFDAWDNKTREDGRGSRTRRQGLAITGTWATNVAKLLRDAGWTETLYGTGKPTKPVYFGYGMSLEIDETTLHLTAPNPLELYVR